MKNLYYGKDFNKIYWAENKFNNTLMKLAVNYENFHVFMLMKIIIIIAGRSILLCETLEKERKKGKWKFGKVMSISKGIFL